MYSLSSFFTPHLLLGILFGFTSLPAMEQINELVKKDLPNGKASLELANSLSDKQEEKKETTYQFPYVIFTDFVEVLNTLISKEKKGIYLAMFRFTHYSPALSLLAQMNREKIKVRLLVNHDYQTDSIDAIELLVKNNIPVRASKKPESGYSHMHNKFIIFRDVEGKALVWTGSWNATGQANKNSENVIILDTPEAIKKFSDCFVEHWAAGTVVAESNCTYNGKQKSDYARRLNGIPQTPPLSRSSSSSSSCSSLLLKEADA